MSTLLQAWQAGRGLPDTLVLDAHGHIGEWPHGANFDTPEQAAEGAERMMDAYGVHATCVLAGGYWMTNGADYRLGNDFLLACVRLLPARLIPFAHFNPNDDQESLLRELQRMVDEGVRGIKLINAYQGYPGDGPNLMALYEFAQRHRVIIHNHSWSEDELRTITSRFPDLTLIRAHGGASALSAELLPVYDNIWSLWPLGRIEEGLQRHGPDKIVFGSDAFMNDPSVGLGMVVYAEIPDQHKRAVLGLNIAQLLDRAGVLPAQLHHWLA